MEDRKPARASAHRRARHLAEELDRRERELELAEQRLGEELYDNTARFDEAFQAGLAEQDALVDRMKERSATASLRVREAARKALAGLGRHREAVADEPEGGADAAPRD